MAAVSKIEFEPPNGGWEAWRTVFGSFLLQTSSYGYVTACGVFTLYYKQVMLPEYSASQLGWIATIAVFLIFGFGIPIGALVDRYGTRPVVAPFVALGIVSLGLLSLCKTYWQIVLSQGVAFGLACSGTTLPAVICVTQWFSTRRGLAVGLASSGSSFGGLIFPIMVSRLINSHGFKTAIHWSTLVVGCCMIVGLICCEGPFPPKRMAALQEKEAIVNHSSESSKLADPSVESSRSDEQHDPNNLGVPCSIEDTATPDQPASKDLGMRHNLIPWIAFCLGVFCCTFSLLVPFDYLPSIALEAGMDRDLSQYTLAMINAGSMIGRIVPGFISDHVGQFNIMALVTTLSAITLLVIWLPVYYFPTNGGIIFFALAYGFVSGGYTSLLSPCVVALVDGQVTGLGLKFGVACLCLAFGALVGIPVSGAVADKTGNWGGLIGLSGSMMALGALAFIFSRVQMGGWKLMTKV
ncbi:uncharacterized protein N7479_006081 [Penicillium vulpinum]|uniref:Major facilitator superfamily (MFS) profile domain-containing protein n=1 Tax=Penicillium vulpinum TaxID=29845 RepID=A0A1V6SF90_9EURO|nr:uncharacterized protein N7479_006081 [Penicillium vulpinum]KAJ5958931.1 hypothetical protein N7479_006081 [Penicillium vulpinum]OQE12588.1 hypothetical protein PENVUL_c001G03712 [Penicillium vulpinum]